jgi:hypothetical protein
VWQLGSWGQRTAQALERDCWCSMIQMCGCCFCCKDYRAEK